MSDFAPRARPIELFGPSTHNSTPTLAWNVSEFKAVDDRVRGGSSQSKVEIVQGAPGQGQGQGQLKFSGFLDTTTLGGAGFASQQHFTDPAFPISLPAEKFSGLSLRVKPSPSNSSTSTASDNANQTQPGGGKGPVTLYNFNLYTSHPDQRPDGRNSSSIVYEANFNVTQPTAIYASEPVTDEKLYAVPHSHHRPNANPSTPSLISFDLTWDAFKPTYRGRPAEDAPPLDPQKIALWSLMARSNFSQQSGPFELQVESIWAIPGGNDVVNASKVHPRSWEEAFEPAHLTGAPGFALYLFATIAFLLWICWALTPDAVLRKIGIQWYPDREWAFLLPSYSLLLVLLAYVVYMAINLRMTPDLTHLSTVVVTLKRADAMTYDEAVHYYRTEHPYGPRLSASSTSTDRDRHVRDLPI